MMIRYLAIGAAVAFFGFILLVIPFGLVLIGMMGSDTVQTAQSGNIIVHYGSSVTESEAVATAEALCLQPVLGTLEFEIEYGLSKKGNEFNLDCYVTKLAQDDEQDTRATHEFLAAMISQQALKGAPVSVDIFAEFEPWLSIPPAQIGTPLLRDRYIVFYSNAVSEQDALAAEKTMIEVQVLQPETCQVGLLMFVDKQQHQLKIGFKGNQQALGTMDQDELQAAGKQFARAASLNVWNGGEVQFSYTLSNGVPLQGFSYEWHAVDGQANLVVEGNITLVYDESVSDDVANRVAKKIASISTVKTIYRIKREADAFQVDFLSSDAVRERNEKAESMVSVVGRQIAGELPQNSWLTLGVADDDMNRLWSLPIEWTADQIHEFEFGNIYYTENLTKEDAEKLAMYLVNSGFNPAGEKWEFNYDFDKGYHRIQMTLVPDAIDDQVIAYLELIIENVLNDFGEEPALFELVDPAMKLIEDHRWTLVVEEPTEPEKTVHTSFEGIESDISDAFPN